MQSTLQESNDTAVWHQLAPLLDEAMSRLNQRDRDAVMLRFFKDQSVRDIAAALQINEAAAQRRLLRAVEKLRSFFIKRGIAVPAGVLTATISANSVQAAPVALAKSVTTVAVVKGAAASASTLTLIKGALKLMAWTKAKTVIVAGVIALLAAGTTTVVVKKVFQPFDPWTNADSLSREFSEAIRKQMADDKDSEAGINGNSKAVAERFKKRQDEINNIFKRYSQKAPAGVFIRPTHFPEGRAGSTRHGDDLMVEIQQPFTRLFSIAYEETDRYEITQARMILSKNFPVGNFDFLVNVPDHGLEHFQDQIKKQFGLVAHVEMRETNILVLKVRNPAAPGLQPNAQTSIIGPGFFGSEELAGDLEQEFFNQPVVDETHLTGSEHVFLVPFKPVDLDALKQTLLDEYGLELVPERRSIKMLVVEKAQ